MLLQIIGDVLISDVTLNQEKGDHAYMSINT